MIEVQLNTPNGPRVRYTADREIDEIENEIPDGYTVDWSNTVVTGLVDQGRRVYSAPLVLRLYRIVGDPVGDTLTLDEVTKRFTLDRKAYQALFALRSGSSVRVLDLSDRNLDGAFLKYTIERVS